MGKLVRKMRAAVSPRNGRSGGTSVPPHTEKGAVSSGVTQVDESGWDALRVMIDRGEGAATGLRGPVRAEALRGLAAMAKRRPAELSRIAADPSGAGVCALVEYARSRRS